MRPDKNKERETDNDPKVAKFIGGIAKASQLEMLPLKDFPRIAFAGRSNVGKSSLLNALTKLKVARVSAEPGKTREMNFYQWRKAYLVDLPGYGYAKVSKSLREDWGREIQVWIETDPNLALVVVLVDGRHSYQKQDIELIQYLQTEDLPFIVAFTKMDKYKSGNKKSVAVKMLSSDSANIGVGEHVCVSSTEKDGLSDLYNKILPLLK